MGPIYTSLRIPQGGKRNLRLEDLVEQAWVLPPPGSLVQTNSHPVFTNLLRMTNMLAPLPREAVQPEFDRGDLIVLMDARPPPAVAGSPDHAGDAS